MSTTNKIGWIGLGNMGNPMVKNLVKAGFEVAVYNRNPEKSKALQAEVKVEIAASLAELAGSSDFIFTMLSDDAALKEVYQSETGLLAAVQSHKFIAIDMSTVSPETTKILAALCREKGIDYLDAPVSGSVKPAEEAQLIILAGGEEAVYEKAKPMFAAMGKLSTLLGPNGAGNVAKLAINLFLGITAQGLAEAVIFAEKNGIQSSALLPLINAGAVGSGLTKLKTENIVSNNYKAAFALKLLAKDIRLATANGMDTPIGGALSQTLAGAVEKGFGEEDMIAVLRYLKA